MLAPTMDTSDRFAEQRHANSPEAFGHAGFGGPIR
jgi:hypothetical protein